MNVVNRLIYSRLAAGQSVALPDIGTLVVSQSEAKVTGGKVIAPERSVSFTDSDTQGVESIVNAIARDNNTTQKEAQKIYDEWRKEFATEKGNINFEDSGELYGGSFDISEKLQEEMNPFSDGTKKHRDMGNNRNRSYGWLWGLGGIVVGIGIAIAVLGLFHFDGHWTTFKTKFDGRFHRDIMEHTCPCTDNANEDDANYDELMSDDEPIDSAGMMIIGETIEADQTASQSETTEPTAQTQEPAKSEQTTKPAPVSKKQQPARYYLIAGVFTLPSNADKLIRDNIYYSTSYQKFPYKGGTAVSVYSSTSRSDVEQRKFELEDIDTELWILKR